MGIGCIAWGGCIGFGCTWGVGPTICHWLSPGPTNCHWLWLWVPWVPWACNFKFCMPCTSCHCCIGVLGTDAMNTELKLARFSPVEICAEAQWAVCSPSESNETSSMGGTGNIQDIAGLHQDLKWFPINRAGCPLWLIQIQEILNGLECPVAHVICVSQRLIMLGLQWGIASARAVLSRGDSCQSFAFRI